MQGTAARQADVVHEGVFHALERTPHTRNPWCARTTAARVVG
ncbi:hypothetical protein ACWEV9_02195 [Streptomyces albogriseolus]